MRIRIMRVGCQRRRSGGCLSRVLGRWGWCSFGWSPLGWSGWSRSLGWSSMGWSRSLGRQATTAASSQRVIGIPSQRVIGIPSQQVIRIPSTTTPSQPATLSVLSTPTATPTATVTRLRPTPCTTDPKHPNQTRASPRHSPRALLRGTLDRTLPFRTARLPPRWLDALLRGAWHPLEQHYLRHCRDVERHGDVDARVGSAAGAPPPPPTTLAMRKVAAMAMGRLGRPAAHTLRHLARPVRGAAAAGGDAASSVLRSAMVGYAAVGDTAACLQLHRAALRALPPPTDTGLPLDVRPMVMYYALRLCAHHEAGDRQGMAAVARAYERAQEAYLSHHYARHLALYPRDQGSSDAMAPMDDEHDDADDEHNDVDVATDGPDAMTCPAPTTHPRPPRRAIQRSALPSLQRRSVLTVYPEACWRWLDRFLAQGGGDWRAIRRALFHPVRSWPCFPVTGDTVHALLRVTDPTLRLPRAEARRTTRAATDTASSWDASWSYGWRRMRYHAVFRTFLGRMGPTKQVPGHVRTSWLRGWEKAFRQQRLRYDAERQRMSLAMAPSDGHMPWIDPFWVDGHGSPGRAMTMDDTIRSPPTSPQYRRTDTTGTLVHDPFDVNQFDLLLKHTTAQTQTVEQWHLILQCLTHLNRRYEVMQWIRQHAADLLPKHPGFAPSSAAVPIPDATPDATPLQPMTAMRVWGGRRVLRDILYSGMKVALAPHTVCLFFRALVEATCPSAETEPSASDAPNTLHPLFDDEEVYLLYLVHVQGVLTTWRHYMATQVHRLLRASRDVERRRRLFYHVFAVPLLTHASVPSARVRQVLSEAMTCLLPEQCATDGRLVQLMLLQYDVRRAVGEETVSRSATCLAPACQRIQRRLVWLDRQDGTTADERVVADLTMLEGLSQVSSAHPLFRHFAHAFAPWCPHESHVIPTPCLSTYRHRMLSVGNDMRGPYGQVFRLFKIALVYRHGTTSALDASWADLLHAPMCPMHKVMEDTDVSPRRNVRRRIRKWFRRYTNLTPREIRDCMPFDTEEPVQFIRYAPTQRSVRISSPEMSEMMEWRQDILAYHNQA